MAESDKNPAENLLEEKQADYQWYEAAGSHFEIGRITARHAVGGNAFEKPLDPAQRRFAEQCREITAKFYPEIVEEFAGYASGLNVSEDSLLPHYSMGVTGGCSGIVLDTPQGRLAGRNYDFFYWESRRHLIHTRPTNGYSHIGVHEGLIGGRFDGLNEKGLFVSFNGAGEHPDPSPLGITFSIIVRYLLEKCADALEARDALRELPLKEPKSYLLADRHHAFVAEAHPSRKEFRPLEDGRLFVTNHYVNPEMAAYQPPWPNSVARYNKLEAAAPGIMQSPQAERELQSLFAEHTAPVCGHRDGLATFWSCTANLDTGEISYSLGAPCRNEYKQYFKFAATPLPVAP